MYAITRRLTAQQAPTRNGGAWDPATIRKMLRNPAYIGKAAYRQMRAEYAAADHAARAAGRAAARSATRRGGNARARNGWRFPCRALVSDETFAWAQAQLGSTIGGLRADTRSVPSLLQGLLVCAQCGYAIHRKRGVYRCWGRDAWRRRPKAGLHRARHATGSARCARLAARSFGCSSIPR